MQRIAESSRQEIFNWTNRKFNWVSNTRKVIRVSMNLFHRVPNHNIICTSGDKDSHVYNSKTTLLFKYAYIA